MPSSSCIIVRMSLLALVFRAILDTTWYQVYAARYFCTIGFDTEKERAVLGCTTTQPSYYVELALVAGTGKNVMGWLSASP